MKLVRFRNFCNVFFEFVWRNILEIKNNLRLSLLFDIYGKLLTEKQISVLKDFLDFDFSLSEIAEANSTSRQSVNDLVKRSLKTLEDYEVKLQILEKFEKIKLHISICSHLLSEQIVPKYEISCELNKLLEVL
ncbi:MAG: DNA-binding protein [Clostridia bacterium]|nr:DNA-binding protein [Clostridia bacterium]